MSDRHTSRDDGLSRLPGSQMSLLFDSASRARKSGSRRAPTAPLSRPEAQAGAIALEASFTRHTGPHDATFGDALRLLATWAVRAGHASRPGDVQESPFCVADTRESE